MGLDHGAPRDLRDLRRHLAAESDTFGRIVGIIAASIGAIGALLAVGGAYPFWSLGIFALCVICIHGLVVYGEDVDDARAG